MAVTAELNDKQFRRAIGELSKISGKTYSETMKKAGIGPVIKILAKNKAAKPPSVREIRNDVEKRTLRKKFSTNEGEIATTKDGKSFFRKHAGADWRLVFGPGRSIGWHLSDRDWAAFQSIEKQRKKHIVDETKRIKERRGLLRMSFIQIADNLNIDLNVVGGGALSEKIPRRAKVPRGLGSASESSESKQWEAVMKNFSRGLSKKGAAFWRSRLQSAINRRTKAIEIDMEKGTFNDIEKRAKRYPGLFVRRSA